MIKSIDRSVKLREVSSLQLNLLIFLPFLFLSHRLFFFFLFFVESVKSVEFLLRFCLECCDRLLWRLLQNLYLFLQLVYCLVNLCCVHWWKQVQLMESVQCVNTVVQGLVVCVLWLDFFWLLGFFRLNLIHLTLFALNYLTSTLCFFLPSLLLSQIDIFSISLRLLLSSLVVIGIGSDIFTVLDHEFAQFDGLPVGVSVDKGLPFGLEFKFSLLFAFFSFLFLLDSFLSSFLSFFELFFFLSLSFGLFLFSSFILLFALSFVIDFFLDVLYVSQ